MRDGQITFFNDYESGEPGKNGQTDRKIICVEISVEKILRKILRHGVKIWI